MRKGDELSLDLSDLDDAGAGIAQHEGMTVHVPGALPGEHVRVTVDHVSPHKANAWAVLRDVIKRSPRRIDPACPAQGDCGGCVLQHLDVSDQLGWKTRRVLAAMHSRAALQGLTVAGTVPSPRDLGYRNRSKLVCGRAASRLVLGAYAPRSHRIIDLAGCRIVEPILDRTAGSLRTLLEHHDIRPYDERKSTGQLRYAVLRANAEGQVLVVLVTYRREFPEGRGLAAALRVVEPEVIGVVQDVNPSHGNIIHGEELVPLDGDVSLVDSVGPVRLQLSPQAFFQANRDVAATAYQAIVAGLEPRPEERAVDAYAGVGGIALTLAPHVADVVGIEQHEGAVRDAEASAALNGIRNARFRAGDAGALLSVLDHVDLIVLNPPRQGCEATVLDAVLKLRPRAIAYLSCDPDTLARDLERLVHSGYSILAPLQPFDMMPHTPHVETLAILRRA